MRLLSSFLLPALCWRLAGAVEDVGHIYIHNPDQSQEPSESRTLSPTVARLVMAQRMGVVEFHSADLHNTEEILGPLNEYGVHTPMFANQKKDSMKRALLYVEGEKNKEYLDTHFPTRASISDEPSSQSAWELYEDLQTQSLSLGDHYPFSSFLEDADASNTLSKLAGSNTAITILYLPLTPQAAGASAEWGTYRMPNTPSLLHKRNEPQEEPLEVDFKPVESSKTTPNTLLASSPLPGIFPSCFPSLSSCEDLTRNCTGHGSCSLKYTDKSAEPAKQCYSCQCEATVKKDSEGRVSTTYWGGPACQKRDVSVQFWLIALFTVGLVGLVSFAVGQVWSMGDEELPSVIGAGVSGPVARR